MNEVLAFIAYGLLLLGGLFMTFFWGRVAYRRATQMKWEALQHDTYMVLSAALCLSSIGTGLLFAGRAYSFMAGRISTVSSNSVAAYMVLLGLFIMAGSKAGFIWAIHLDRKSWVWRAFIALSIFWTVLAVWWAVNDPLDVYPYDGGQSHGGSYVAG